MATRSAQPQKCLTDHAVEIVNRDLAGAVCVARGRCAARGREGRMEGDLGRAQRQDVSQHLSAGADGGDVYSAGQGALIRYFPEDLVGQRGLAHAGQANQCSAAAGFVEAPLERSPLQITADEPLVRCYGPVPDKWVGSRHSAFPTLLALSHSANSPTRIRSRPLASRSRTSRAKRSRTSGASSVPTSCEVIDGFSATRVSSARYRSFGARATDSPAAVMSGSNLSVGSAEGPLVSCSRTSPTTDSVMKASRFLLRCWTRRSQKIWR